MKNKFISMLLIALIISPFLISAQKNNKAITISKVSENIVDPTKAYIDGDKIIMNYFGAKVEYNYKITNNLDTSIQILSVDGVDTGKDYLINTVEDINIGDKIAPKGTINFKVITEVVDNGYDAVTSVSRDLNLTVSFKELKEEKNVPINTENTSSINGTIYEKNIDNSQTLDNVGVYIFLIGVAVVGTIVCIFYLRKIKVLNLKSITIGSLAIICAVTGAVVITTLATENSVLESSVKVPINFKNSYFLNPGVSSSIIDTYNALLENYNNETTQELVKKTILDINESIEDFYGKPIDNNIHISQVIFDVMQPEEFQNMKQEILRTPASDRGEVYDMSASRDYRIIGYFTDDELITPESGISNCSTYYYLNETECSNARFVVLHIVSDKKIFLNENCSSLFSQVVDTGFTFSMRGLENVDTRYVTDMESMFAGFGGRVKTVPVSAENGLNGKIRLDLQHFNTKRVETMKGMFTQAKIHELILGNGTGLWDTSNVKNMNYMFEMFPYEAINIEKLNTSSCETMRFMFSGYGFLVAKGANEILLDLSEYDVSKVKDMSYMFYHFGSTDPLVTYFSSDWFNAAEYDENDPVYVAGDGYHVENVFLNLSNWDAQNVETFNSMFKDTAYKAEELQIALAYREAPGKPTFFRTKKATDYSNMFDLELKSDSTRIELDIAGFDTRLDFDNKAVLNLSNMFNSRNIKRVFVEDKWSTAKAIPYDPNIEGSTRNIFGSGTNWILGTAGTSCSGSYGLDYAKLDGGPDSPGCFSDYETYYRQTHEK